ncbi:transmembrane protein, putative [Bodo saltans]|uniref:Transmembrane protein, putative n=1 Tax=Bodo saltans TaxID=75058 RepID=A0A0S4IYI6_BODSA|nr:transmembrane protein, putative [Bodo saltans]|eukprot:CUG20461.1 transmembrane protein, putative [Bodo saltans]
MTSKMISNVVALMPSNSTTPVGGASTERIWAAPVSRSDLLEGLPLAMNLSINAAASGWNVYQVEVFIGANDAADTRIGDVAEFFVFGDNITGQQQGAYKLLLLISPPNNRWLPASTSTFVSTNIMLRVTLQCSRDMNALESATVVFSAPGETRPLAEEVRATLSVAQWASTLGDWCCRSCRPCRGCTEYRSLCDGTGGNQGPLGLALDAPTGCITGSQAESEYRGTIFGNLLLLCCAAVVLALVTVLYSRATSKSIRLSTEDLGMPSRMYPVLVVVTPSSVVATFSLLKAGTDCAVDTIIAVIGVVMSLLPLTTVAFGVCMLCLHGFVQEKSHHSPSSIASKSSSDTDIDGEIPHRTINLKVYDGRES